MSSNRLETVCWLIYFYFDIAFLTYFSNSYMTIQEEKISLYHLILSWGIFFIFWGIEVTQLIASIF